MTGVLDRPKTTPADAPPRPAVLSGAATALAVSTGGVLGFLGLASLAWVAGPGGSVGSALRAGATAWLIGHGSGLDVGAVTVTAVPLGCALLAVGALTALGHHLGIASAIDTGTRLVAFVGGCTVTYTCIVAVVAALVSGSSVTVSVARAVLGGLLIGLLGGLGGAVATPVVRAWRRSLPDHVRAAILGSAAGASALVGAGLVLVLALLVGDAGTAYDLWAGLAPGVSGGIALLVISILVLPNAALWAVSAMLGPGFAVGADTSVSLTHVELGPVPGFPLLAALPGPGDTPGPVVGLAIVPVLAGVLAGVVVARRLLGAGRGRSVLVGAIAGACAGLVVAGLLAVSGGAIGPGRMVQTGPVVLLNAVIAVVSMAAGGALGALGGHYRVAGAHDRPARDRASRPSRRPGVGRGHQSPGTSGGVR